jgi:hypothetical protein
MEAELKIAEKFGKTLLTRSAGKRLRASLFELLVTDSVDLLVLDFNGVDSISTSFADEAFGKLINEIGDIDVMAKIKPINTGPGVFGMLRMAMKGRTRPA